MDRCETQERARTIQELMETAQELLLGLEFAIRDRIMSERVNDVALGIANISAVWGKIRAEL